VSGFHCSNVVTELSSFSLLHVSPLSVNLTILDPRARARRPPRVRLDQKTTTVCKAGLKPNEPWKIMLVVCHPY